MYGQNNVLGAPIKGPADPSIAGTAQAVLSTSEGITSRLAGLLAHLDGGGIKENPEQPRPLMPIMGMLATTNDNLHKAHELIAILERKIFG